MLRTLLPGNRRPTSETSHTMTQCFEQPEAENSNVRQHKMAQQQKNLKKEHIPKNGNILDQRPITEITPTSCSVGYMAACLAITCRSSDVSGRRSGWN